MVYGPRKKKISQFTAGSAVTGDTKYSSLQDGINKTFTQEQLIADFADVYGASLRTFEFESDLVVSDIQIDEYCIVEENRYTLYKITSAAANLPNIALDSGFTAERVRILEQASPSTYAEILAENPDLYAANDVIYLSGDGIAGEFKVVASAISDSSAGVQLSNAAWNAAGKHLKRVDIFDIYASWYDFPTSTGTDSATSVQASIDYAASIGGAITRTPSGSVDLETTIEIKHGCALEGQGNPHTFNSFTDSTVFNLITDGDTTLTGIQIGESGTDSALRNRSISVKNIKVRGQLDTEGVGFATVDTDLAGNDKDVHHWRMENCSANSVLVGFNIINSWNYVIDHAIATQSGTGFKISGAGASAGTSSTWISCIAYSCDIGFDIGGVGWNYSSMHSCGADGCQTGLQLTDISARGSTIRNFGIENIDDSSGQGYGIYINSSGSGFWELDGVNFGDNDSANITYIYINSAVKSVFRNIQVTSAVLNSCIFYEQSSSANAGRVTFDNLYLFTDSATEEGDIFASNVVLIDCNINGRYYSHAIGGVDSIPQSVNYTSSTSGVDGQGTSNKRIYSTEMLANTDNATNNRFITGAPAFDTSNVADWEYIKFTNRTDPANPAQIGFRSEDHTAGTGIHRDSALSAGTTITLATPGDWVVFQKRPDGDLYQVEFVEVGI